MTYFLSVKSAGSLCILKLCLGSTRLLKDVSALSVSVVDYCAFSAFSLLVGQQEGQQGRSQKIVIWRQWQYVILTGVMLP